MLDLYGWESVFYLSGVLSVLWAYCMWKYLLKGEGEYTDGAFESDERPKEKLFCAITASRLEQIKLCPQTDRKSVV